MKKDHRWGLKIVVLVLFLLFILELSYFLSFLRYKDSNYVSMEGLRIENAELKKDNEELYQFFSLEQPSFFVSRVGIRNIHQFYEEILVENKDYEVQIGDPVFSPLGLVGVITRVDQMITVKLLTSSVSVSVKVGDTYGTYQDGKIKMLEKGSSISVGDKIYTSGLTSIPEGLYVGEITKLLPDKENLGMEAEVKLIDTTQLNYVGIFTRRE